MANQQLSGSNGVGKKKVGYHRRSVAETAVFRIKILPGGHLSLQAYDALERPCADEYDIAHIDVNHDIEDVTEQC